MQKWTASSRSLYLYVLRVVKVLGYSQHHQETPVAKEAFYCARSCTTKVATFICSWSWMLPLNLGQTAVFECHRSIIPKRTQHKTRSKQWCFILPFPSSEYFTRQGFLETMFSDLTTLEMCSMNELPREEGGLDACTAEGQEVRAPGIPGDQDSLPARWFSAQGQLGPSSTYWLCSIPAGYCYTEVLGRFINARTNLAECTPTSPSLATVLWSSKNSSIDSSQLTVHRWAIYTHYNEYFFLFI